MRAIRFIVASSFTRNLMWIVPIAFFFLNPNVGCGSDEPQFQFGAAEMRAAVEGDWSFTITPSGGAAAQVTVNIDQSAAAVDGSTARAPGRGLLRAAYACGGRTLVKSAGACIDVTGMPLTVSYVAGDSAFSGATMSGTFSVYGLSFASGDLELVIGPYRILAQVNADGSFSNARLALGGTLTASRP
jgi:hypothetical protein